jgi:hypothetical protein
MRSVFCRLLSLPRLLFMLRMRHVTWQLNFTCHEPYGIAFVGSCLLDISCFSLSLQRHEILLRVEWRFCGLVVTVPGYRFRGSRFDSRPNQLFWEVMGLERGPLGLVSTIEERLEEKNSSFGAENREYGLRDPLCWPRGTFYPQKLTITSPASCGRSVGIVRP